MGQTLYNVKNIHVTLVAGGTPYLIECRHEDGFEDDPKNDASTSTTGSCGQKVINITVDKSFGITVSLLYGSSENKTMEKIFAEWTRAGGNYPMSITTTDENSKETYTYPNVTFKKRAALSYTNEGGNQARKWELESDDRTFVEI